VRQRKSYFLRKKITSCFFFRFFATIGCNPAGSELVGLVMKTPQKTRNHGRAAGKTNISVSVSDRDLVALDRLRQDENRSRSNYIQYLINKELREHQPSED
jgi:membrane peptidoglycan carboxypeptidase